ncbi:MAG: TOBE domain-containing protein [Campylobacteraceae bacterium]
MAKFNVGSSIWVNKQDKSFLGKGRIELLKLIDETGSLSKAAKIMKMSYKAAWDSLNAMNSVSAVPLTQSATGGKGGGGSTLTPMAHLYIQLYEKIYEEQKNFFESIEKHIDDYDTLVQFLNRTSIRTSARNQLKGKIVSIKKDGLNSLLKIDSSGLTFYTNITTKSVEELDLEHNKELFLIIKSSWIDIVEKKDEDKKQNLFSATIKNIEKDKNSDEYLLELENSSTLICSNSTKKEYKKGDKVSIFIDPKQIIVGV